METFGAEPDDPVEVCQHLASQADAVIVIVAHRYGWVPTPAEGGDGKKSITWLEVEAAADHPVFAFVVDPTADWNQPKEQDGLVEAPTPDDVMRIYRAVQGLQELKVMLGRRVRDQFTTPDSLQAKVALSLAPWLIQ